MRDGVPLPGLSPADLVSQLLHRVFGPLRVDSVRLMLDYHGLAGQPAGLLKDLAARHGISSPTVRTRVAKVRTAGARLPLPPAVLLEVSRASVPGEDHLGRTRIALTFAVPLPAAPPQPLSPPPVPTAGQVAITRAAGRILAAVGPLDTETLLVAIRRSRRFRARTALAATDLTVLLTATGLAELGGDGRWHHAPGVRASDRYRVIVAAGGGRELTRQQMIDILIDAGYSTNSATGRMSSSHPLFHRVGPDRYRIIGS